MRKIQQGQREKIIISVSVVVKYKQVANSGKRMWGWNKLNSTIHVVVLSE
jgi:hypothetical protein